jgi:hypothetical protein
MPQQKIRASSRSRVIFKGWNQGESSPCCGGVDIDCKPEDMFNTGRRHDSSLFALRKHMRWLAFLLLFALNVQTLPTPRWGQQASRSFYGSSEEEVHDDCDTEKKAVAEKWSAPPPSHAARLILLEVRMLTALEVASRPSCLHAPEVLSPPPDCCWI